MYLPHLDSFINIYYFYYIIYQELHFPSDGWFTYLNIRTLLFSEKEITLERSETVNQCEMVNQYEMVSSKGINKGLGFFISSIYSESHLEFYSQLLPHPPKNRKTRNLGWSTSLWTNYSSQSSNS